MMNIRASTVLLAVAVLMLGVMSMNINRLRKQSPNSQAVENEMAVSATLVAITSVVVLYESGLARVLANLVKYRSTDGTFLLASIFVAAMSWDAYNTKDTSQSKRIMSSTLLVVGVVLALLALNRSLCSRSLLPLNMCM